MLTPMSLSKTIYTFVCELFSQKPWTDVVKDLQVYSSPSVMDLISYTKQSSRKVSVLEESYYAENNNQWNL